MTNPIDKYYEDEPPTDPKFYGMGFVYGYKNVQFTEDGKLCYRFAGSHGWTHTPRMAKGEELMPTGPVEAVCHNNNGKDSLQRLVAQIHHLEKLKEQGLTNFQPDDPEPTPHRTPEEHCSCGFYAWTSVQEAVQQNLGFSVVGPIARVKAWGKIVRCTHGFRSQFQEIDALFIRDRAPLPRTSVNMWGRKWVHRFLGIRDASEETYGMHSFLNARAYDRYKEVLPIYFLGSQRLGGKELVEYFDEWQAEHAAAVENTLITLPQSEIPAEMIDRYSGSSDK